MGVQLQSFTPITKAVLQVNALGQATYLKTDVTKNDILIHPELPKLLELYCSRLARHVAGPMFAATYPRSLVVQWKIYSYQPSTSDAIATDG